MDRSDAQTNDGGGSRSPGGDNAQASSA